MSRNKLKTNLTAFLDGINEQPLSLLPKPKGCKNEKPRLMYVITVYGPKDTNLLVANMVEERARERNEEIKSKKPSKTSLEDLQHKSWSNVRFAIDNTESREPHYLASTYIHYAMSDPNMDTAENKKNAEVIRLLENFPQIMPIDSYKALIDPYASLEDAEKANKPYPDLDTERYKANELADYVSALANFTSTNESINRNPQESNAFLGQKTSFHFYYNASEKEIEELKAELAKRGIFESIEDRARNGYGFAPIVKVVKADKGIKLIPKDDFTATYLEEGLEGVLEANRGAHVFDMIFIAPKAAAHESDLANETSNKDEATKQLRCIDDEVLKKIKEQIKPEFNAACEKHRDGHRRALRILVVFDEQFTALKLHKLVLAPNSYATDYVTAYSPALVRGEIPEDYANMLISECELKDYNHATIFVYNDCKPEILKPDIN